MFDDYDKKQREMTELDWKRPDKHRNGKKFGCPFAKGEVDRPVADCKCPVIVL